MTITGAYCHIANPRCRSCCPIIIKLRDPFTADTLFNSEFYKTNVSGFVTKSVSEYYVGQNKCNSVKAT